jgi:hypothetical protein
MPLDKIQTNAMYRLIQSNGLDPRLLVLTRQDDTVLVEHRTSQSRFSARHRVRSDGLSPVFDTKQHIGGAGVFPRVARSFDAVLEDLSQWTDQVARLIADDAKRAREQEEYERLPDLWAELQQSQELLESLAERDEVENSMFAADEQQTINSRLDEIESYLREQFELSGERLTALEEGVSELKEATRRVGKKDWLLMLSGWVFNSVMSAIVPPAAVQHILEMAARGLGHIFGFGAPPPALPPQA